jgi:hypothetical protein
MAVVISFVASTAGPLLIESSQKAYGTEETKH